MKKELKKSLVFITGTFLGNNCWDEWRTYFEREGYSCIAPPWPYKNESPEELRNKNPKSAIASTRLDGLTDYFADIVSTSPEKPIMIGHSLGGLIVQLLLQRGFGAAGVALHSFPLQRVGTKQISFLKAMWGPLGWFTSAQKTYMLPFKKWKHVVTNGMTCEDQKQLYYRYATPESKLVIRDAFKAIGKIDFAKNRAPLLFISGSEDQIISASLNFDNYKNYKVSNSITDYRDFKRRNHLVFGHSTWKEEADFILHWLQEIE